MRKPAPLPTVTIRSFTAGDIPQVMALQRAYQQAYPHGSLIPGEVYLSPGFDSGRNILCAFDEHEQLQGYAPLLPVMAQQEGAPHTAWAEVKTHPSLGPRPPARDLLFDGMLERARQIARTPPARPVRLTFQYHASEAAAIEYVLSRGAACSETVLRMRRDLTGDLPRVGAPAGVTVRRWKMETEPEQQAYIRARNECFPENPASLADWQSFLGSPAWREGVAVTAFEGAEVVGSVAAYPDEGLSQATRQLAASTEFVFVREGWRGRGVAAHLVAEALAYLKELGRVAAYLDVMASNEGAVRLYSRLGYEVADETRFYTLEV